MRYEKPQLNLLESACSIIQGSQDKTGNHRDSQTIATPAAYEADE